MSSNRFTRLHGIHRTETDPNAVPAASRIDSVQVAVGEPVCIQGMIDPEQEAAFRRDVQESLEFLAKKRLLEAEKEAQAFLEKSRQLARNEGEKLVSDLLGKARAEADALIAQAQSEVDGIRDAAHEAGFKNGFEEGYTTALQQVDDETVALLKSANFIVENAYQAERRVLKDFESHALAIIQRIAEKVLCDDLGDISEKVLNLIQRSVESLYLSGKIKIVLNPQVLHELRQFSASTQHAVDALSRFEFIADPALDTYQYFIIGQEGSFDISPTSQTAQLIAPIEKHLKLPRPTLSQNTSGSAPEPPSSSDVERGVQTEPLSNSPTIEIEETSHFSEENAIETHDHSSNTSDYSSNLSKEPANHFLAETIDSEGLPAIEHETETTGLEMPPTLPMMQSSDVSALEEPRSKTETPHSENRPSESEADQSKPVADPDIAGNESESDVSAVLAKLDALTLDAETDRQSPDAAEETLGTPPWMQADEMQTPDNLSAFEAPVVTDNPRVFGRPKEPDGGSRRNRDDNDSGDNDATAFQEINLTGNDSGENNITEFQDIDRTGEEQP